MANLAGPNSIHIEKPPITDTNVWRRLKEQANRLKKRHISDLFRENPVHRGEEMEVTNGTISLNYCREKIDAKALDYLFQLPEEAQLSEAISAMFRGDRINTTENRPVLHTALRLPADRKLIVDGVNIVKQVQSTLRQMKRFTEDVYSGKRLGVTGKKIKHVINIGIGGSDLGSRMAYQALVMYRRQEVDIQFVSNVDPTDLAEALKKINPEETLFIICSKKFTTEETLANANVAKKWIVNALGQEAVSFHFIAVSANKDLVVEFGINQKNMFEMWDWVGGRFSVSSSVGLSLMLGVGPEHFKELLRGMYEMDNHYKNTEFKKNLPVIMALLSIWNTTFLNNTVYSMITYDVFLKLFPKHLQQLLAESLGKSVNTFGQSIQYQTSPVILDALGTDFEHSFNQLIHMGTLRQFALTFLSCKETLQQNSKNAQNTLLAHMFAQADSLAFGTENIDPHKKEYGDVPSSILLLQKLTPFSLGQLIALYEHQVHAQATILQINGFDQFGVEAGKKASTKNILRFLKEDNNLKTIDNMMKKH